MQLRNRVTSLSLADSTVRMKKETQDGDDGEVISVHKRMRARACNGRGGTAKSSGWIHNEFRRNFAAICASRTL